MRLRFLGADRQVTGSRHYFEAGPAKVLIDCGMFQKREFLARNWEPSLVPPHDLDAVLLTHAHVDHCGLLPRLVREGFRGPIYATGASRALVELVLRDSAQIQAEDLAFKRKRHRKEGRRPAHPDVALFTYKDVDRTMPHVESVAYGRPVRIHDQVQATFHDAGHILGSAIVEFAVHENGRSSRVLFSGDLGQGDKPLVCDPTVFDQADYIVMESTYGDRDHPPHEDLERQLEQVICETIGRNGNLVVPTFAIERAQELMYFIHRLSNASRIPKVPVFLDSPMAVHATAIFDKHRECYDEETWRMLDAGDQPLRFPGLKLVKTVEDSKAINALRGPAIIMAPSGMCTAGRIKHHLAHNITRPECTILLPATRAAARWAGRFSKGNARSASTAAPGRSRRKLPRSTASPATPIARASCAGWTPSVRPPVISSWSTVKNNPPCTWPTRSAARRAGRSQSPSSKSRPNSHRPSLHPQEPRTKT